MSGLLLPMPPGDPGALESYASSLSAAAKRIGGLSSKAARVTAGVTAKAGWTGKAADGYSATAGGLAQNVGATASHLNTIASAVRSYAGALRTARTKVAGYNKAAEAASCLAPKKQQAAIAALGVRRDAALAAVIAAQTAGDIAASDVKGAEQGLLSVSSPFVPLGTVGPNVSSAYLLQQVQLLNKELAPPPPNPNLPRAEALPPGTLAREQKQKQFYYWLGGGDLPGTIPENPHVPEDDDDPTDNSLYQSGQDIPYQPADAAGE